MFVDQQTDIDIGVLKLRADVYLSIENIYLQVTSNEPYEVYFIKVPIVQLWPFSDFIVLPKGGDRYTQICIKLMWRFVRERGVVVSLVMHFHKLL